MAGSPLRVERPPRAGMPAPHFIETSERLLIQDNVHRMDASLGTLAYTHVETERTFNCQERQVWHEGET